ncbi:DNA double-strand break repair nuclease NurA [Persephonella sp.]
MGFQLPLPIFKDEARRKSLEEIFENIFVSFEEDEEIESKLDSYLGLITQLRNVFDKEYTVQVKDNIYPIGINELNVSFLEKVIKTFKGKWVISIDESQHEEEQIAGSVFYRNSLAFGFKLTKEDKDERILSIISSIKYIEDSDTVKRKIELQTYIQNLLVGIYASAILISEGEGIHSVLLDGPLIRMLGPFLTVKFTKDELEKMFTLDKGIKRDFLPPTKIKILDKNLELYDIATGGLLELIFKDKTYKEIDRKLRSENDLKSNLHLGRNEIPGIVIYFYLLKILIEMSKEYDFNFVSCVKSTERTTEFLKVYFIQALIKYTTENKTSELYKEIQDLLNKRKIDPIEDAEKLLNNIIKLNIKDDQVLTFALDFKDETAVYLSPVEIRRHRGITKNEEEILNKNCDISNWRFGSADPGWQEKFLERLIIEKIMPDIKFMMTYIRTSELKAPLRIEFPNYREEKIKDIIASIYLFSYPYQYYGIPIMLKYVDDLVRVPSKTFKTISKGFVSEKLINTLISEDISVSEIKPMINSILELFKRDFLSRGGIL